MRILLAVFLALATTATQAAEIRLLTTGAFKQIPVALVPRFEQETGHKVVIENDTAGALERKVQAGAPFDLLVLTPAAIDALVKDGKVAAGSRTDLAKVGIGVAVLAGAPKPDIASADAFKQTLLDARFVAYIDPHAGGSSGIYLDTLLLKLGIAEQIRPKAVLVPGGLVAEKLIDGRATLALQQTSELMAVKGVDYVGPLPPDLQNYTVYSAGIAAGTKEPEAARALLKFLSGPEAAALLKEKGMSPAS